MNIDELERLARAATPGPWCYESCGEKGDGANIIGVAFGPDDDECNRPMFGYLPPYDEGGEEIEYYRDERVAICEHSDRNSGANAAYIAACSPDTILALIERVRAAEGALREAQWPRFNDDLGPGCPVGSQCVHMGCMRLCKPEAHAALGRKP